MQLPFGYEFKKNPVDKTLGRIAPPMQDGSTDIEGYNGDLRGITFLDFDYAAKNEADLIQKYRDVAKLSSVEDALDEIVNEAIVVQDQEKIVDIVFNDATKLSTKVQEMIVTEFDYLLGLLNFHDFGDQIFRQWYIDGRQYFHKVVVDNKPHDGIKELTWLDPRKTLKIREFEKKKIKGTAKPGQNADIEVTVIKREYFLFDPTMEQKKPGVGAPAFSSGRYQTRMELSPDIVAYTTSGRVDHSIGMVESYLHPAIKPANQLSLLEDSMVVYRLTRAPERRIFYIDVGNLPPGRAEQHVAKTMAKYKNKLVYDVNTGKIDAAKVHMSMQEDFWLPRKEGGRSTEVTTLPAGQNLGSIEDITYFKRNLAQALNVPVSRLDSESTFNIGISGEIKRDELKFSKFVDKIRRRFNLFFYDILKTQLVLKKIITTEDWELNRSYIQFKYNRDSYVTELQDAEMWKQRMELMALSLQYTGKDKYLSMAWNYKNILKISDEDQKEIKKNWKDEPDVPIPSDADIAIMGMDQQADVDQQQLDLDHKTAGVKKPVAPAKRPVPPVSKNEE